MNTYKKQDNTQVYKAANSLVLAVNDYADKNLTQELADIVKLHAAIAVAGAFVPVPGLDMAALAANTWTMYVRINQEVGLPFGKNMVKSLATGVVTNIGSNVIGLLAMGSIVKFIPGLGTFGGGVILAATMYSITLTAGVVYMKALAALKELEDDWSDVDERDMKNAVDEVLNDKDAIDKMMKDSKQEYKDNKKDIDDRGKRNA